MNLAQNATQRHRRRHHCLGSALTDSDARFWVRDTGEALPSLTRRGSSSASTEARVVSVVARGAGLGLAIDAGRQGTVEVELKRPVGAQVSFRNSSKGFA